MSPRSSRASSAKSENLIITPNKINNDCNNSGTATLTGTVFNITTAAIGVGILQIPGVYKEVGWLGGSILLLVAGLFSVVMMKLVSQLMDLAHKYIGKNAKVSTIDELLHSSMHKSKKQKCVTVFAVIIDNLDLTITCVIFLMCALPLMQCMVHDMKFGVLQRGDMNTLKAESWDWVLTDNYKAIDTDSAQEAFDYLEYGKYGESKVFSWIPTADIKTIKKDDNASSILKSGEWVICDKNIKQPIEVKIDAANFPCERLTTGVYADKAAGVSKAELIGIVIVLGLLFITTPFKDMGALSKLSSIGVVGAIVAGIFCVVGSVSQIINVGATTKASAMGRITQSADNNTGDAGAEEDGMKWVWSLGQAFSVIWFSFALPILAPSMKSDMQKPGLFNQAVDTSHILILFIYLTVAFTAYFAFGDDISIKDNFTYTILNANFSK